MGQIVADGNGAEPLPPSRLARKVIGSRRLAFICARTDAAIRKWDRPRSKGGTGGLVPAEFQARILKLADEEKLPIGARDLIAEPVQ